MSPRTLTRPLDDASYWRRLLATVHPDRDHGDEELFVFLTALKEHVVHCTTVELSRRSHGQRHHDVQDDDPDRVPFDPDLGGADEHLALTHRVLSIARTLEEA